jgi:energy-coupling factor transporter ATP-binding protein EcfA2
MKTTKIIIRNLFGISERTLDGKSVEITGPKGSGKTSVLDAIRLALTNRSDRDYTIKQGSDEGEILIETNTGLSIDRLIRTTKADAVKVKEGNIMLNRPAEFLSGIFTPLQLNPVEFCQFSRQEKNRVILSLIEFDWDTNWVQEQFGEIPQGVDYSKHILEVLADIQAVNGAYYQSRQTINSEKLFKTKAVEDIAKDIPAGYQAEKWEAYSLSEKYQDLEKKKDANGKIARAKAFRDTYNDKKRGITATRDIDASAAERAMQSEREGINTSIERLKAEIVALETKRAGLDESLSGKIAVIEANYQTALAKLDKDVGVADEWADKEPIDVTELTAEISTAETMKKHLNEYNRMRTMQCEIEKLQAASDELTRKIELARELPAQILSEATIPVDGLTVVDGIPLINDLPISNLSDGELLELCVDISVCRPGQLEIILIDGAERLDKESREKLYQKCKDKGLQLIATRVTDSNELEVIEL